MVHGEVLPELGLDAELGHPRSGGLDELYDSPLHQRAKELEGALLVLLLLPLGLVAF